MAEAIFRQLVCEVSCPWTIGSAGTLATAGAPATPEAREVMLGLGLDIGGHRSRQLSADILADIDLVLTMTENHKQMIQNEFPHLADKVFTVKEYGGQVEELNISDPYGYGLETYRRVADELQEHLALVLGRLQLEACAEPV